MDMDPFLVYSGVHPSLPQKKKLMQSFDSNILDLLELFQILKEKIIMNKVRDKQIKLPF
jgi:hypothetical protein